MDAWPLIKFYVPDANLMIVGTQNDEDRLRNRLRAEQLAGVESCGRIGDAQRDQMYRSCHMLFYLSRQEGFGLARVEAASFGVPLWGVAGIVTEELFSTGTGAMIAKDLSNEASRKLQFLRKSQLARELGCAASARVMQSF
jgi:glycosyltransferase involved in cell wall biosynthesis